MVSFWFSSHTTLVIRVPSKTTHPLPISGLTVVASSPGRPATSCRSPRWCTRASQARFGPLLRGCLMQTRRPWACWGHEPLGLFDQKDSKATTHVELGPWQIWSTVYTWKTKNKLGSRTKSKRRLNSQMEMRMKKSMTLWLF